MQENRIDTGFSWRQPSFRCKIYWKFTFKDGSEYSNGDYKIRILKSLHSKPVTLNDDLGQPIEKPLVQPASMRDYKEDGSCNFYIQHKGQKY